MEFKGLGITFICNRCLKEIQIAVDLPICARHPETQFPCNIVYTMRRNHYNCFLCYNCYNFVRQLLHEITNPLGRYPIPKFLHVNPAWHRTGITHAEYRLIRKQATDLSYITYLSSLIMLYVKTSPIDLWNITSQSTVPESASIEAMLIANDNLSQNMCPIAPQVEMPVVDLWNISSPISSDNILFQSRSESNEFVSVQMIKNVEVYEPTLEFTEFAAIDSIQNVETIRDSGSQLTLVSNNLISVEMIQNVEECEPCVHSHTIIDPEELISDEIIKDTELYKPQPKLESTEFTALDSIQTVEDYEQKPPFESNEFVAVKMNPRESEEVISVEMIENVEECVSQLTLESKELVAVDITQSDEYKNRTTIEFDELISIELMENIEVCESQPELELEFISVEMYVGEHDMQPKLESNELASTEDNEPQHTLKPDKFINIKMTENVLVYEHQPILKSDEMIRNLGEYVMQPRSESDEFIDMIQSVEEPTKKSDEFISVEIQNTKEYELQPRLESKLVDEDKSNEFISVQIIEKSEVCESQPTLESNEFVRIEMIQNVEDCELQSKLEIDELDVDVMQNIVACEPQMLESDELVTIEMIQNIEKCEQPREKSDGLNVALDVFPNIPDCESSLNLEECKEQSISNKLDNKKTIRNNEGDPQPEMKSQNVASVEVIQDITEWKTTSTLNEMFPNVQEQATSDSDENLSVRMLPVIRGRKPQPRLRSGASVGVEMINEDYDQSDTDSHRTYVIDFIPHVRRPRICWEAETLSDEEHDEETIFWAWKRRCPVEHELHRSPARINLQIPNIETVQPNEASAPLDIQNSPEHLWLQDYDSETHTTTMELFDNNESRMQLDMLEEPWSPRERIQDWIFTHATTGTNTRSAPDSNDWILKNHKFSKFTNMNKPPLLMPPISSTSDLAVIDISDESS